MNIALACVSVCARALHAAYVPTIRCSSRLRVCPFALEQIMQTIVPTYDLQIMD